MTVRVYRSSDAGAPVLSGTSGAMVALLDACLVNGYGSQVAAGWTKEFSATNFGVYRASTGTRYYLMVDDTSTFTTADTCKWRGYETMTDATDTGTNPFPSVAQSTNGQTVNKSSNVSATARPWMIIAHEKAFYYFCASTQTGSLAAVGGTSVVPFDVCFFGECKSFKQTTDTYNCFLINLIYTTVNPGTGAESTWGGVASSHWMARNHNGTKISHTTQAQLTGHANNVTKMGPDGSGYYSNLEPGTGELALVAVELIEHSEFSTSPVQWFVRGRFPGHYTSLTNLYTFSLNHQERQCFIVDGTGPHAGRQFMMMWYPWQTGQQATMFAIELTDNWYA